MIFFDTETLGLTGPIVTIQWAIDDGPVKIEHIWNEDVIRTQEIIRMFCSHKGGICAFNLSYDWFHINKLYCMLIDENSFAPLNIDRLAEKEQYSYKQNLCLKPQKALDLFLVARRGKYQATMERKDVWIRNVPDSCVPDLQKALVRHTKIPHIYFARRPYIHPVWEIIESEQRGFCHLRLRFFASSALKAIIYDLKLDSSPDFDAAKEIHRIAPVEDKSHRPWGNGWQKVIHQHIDYWRNNSRAIKYATKDVEYLQQIYKVFGSPPANDVDSELAVCVACVHHRGFSIDLDANRRLLTKANNVVGRRELIAPEKARQYIQREAGIPVKDTEKSTLRKMADAGIKAAKKVIQARRADKVRILCDRLFDVKRFHPDFKVIGARTGRMSGGALERGKGSINPQGIQRSKAIRKVFKLRDSMLPHLCGGDFAAFEVTIQDAVWDSPALRRDLKSGEKIYDIYSRHLQVDVDYHKRKTGFLGWSYGAHEKKTASVLGIDLEVAGRGLRSLLREYPEIKQARDRVAKRFQSMSQPNGLGTAVVWSTPDDYIETLFGFRRYFTLENTICKMLFDMATTLPESILQYRDTVQRNETRGNQEACSATRTALYAAAFNIQSQNVRQANNHVIQGSGAWICKVLQARLWDLQPCGIHPWRMAPFNIHDEIICTVSDEETVNETIKIAKSIEDEFRPKIPLIKLEWKTEMDSWADK